MAVKGMDYSNIIAPVRIVLNKDIKYDDFRMNREFS